MLQSMRSQSRTQLSNWTELKKSQCHFCHSLVRAKLPQSCLTPCNPMDCSLPASSVHGDSPGRNTGVGCHSLLQGIFPIQGSNPHVLHCWRILYHLSHQASIAEIKCVLTNCLKKIILGTFLVVQWLRYSVLSVKWSGSVMSNSATPWTVAYQAPPMRFSR